MDKHVIHYFLGLGWMLLDDGLKLASTGWNAEGC
jgi:hypothetical protein